MSENLVLNLSIASAMAVLFLRGYLRLRNLSKRIRDGEFHLSGIRIRCLLWTSCFGLVAAGFVFVSYMRYPLRGDRLPHCMRRRAGWRVVCVGV